MSDIHWRVVDALNELADVHGTEALSITFSQSDVPIDWDDETRRWDVKYAEASCHVHGEDDMDYDPMAGEWYCRECFIDDELTEIYKHG